MSNRNDNIEIIGAAENNLKHINVTIPKGQLVVFAGVSGSGKLCETNPFLPKSVQAGEA